MKMLIVISLVFATLILNVASHNDRFGNFIIKGNNARRFQFPWQISIIASSTKTPHMSNQCGGVLITAQNALTAAHCCYGSDHFKLLMGEIILDMRTFTQTTRDCKIHEDYIPKTPHNDIALLRFRTIVTTPAARPIALPSGPERHNSFANMMATASGWGRQLNGHSAMYLQHIYVRVMANSECYKFVQNYGPKILCAKGYQIQSICHGDSGGPLVFYTKSRPILIGIASFGSGECVRQNPMGFMRVTEYLTWIHNHL